MTETLLRIFIALAIAAVTILGFCWTVGLIDKLEELKYNRRKRNAEILRKVKEWEWEDDGI